MACRARIAGLALAAIVISSSATGDDAQPTFELPVACAMGEQCFVQNHVDHDAGPGFGDYTCGSLSFDRHTGTDFTMVDRAPGVEPVAVLAAADGRVKTVGVPPDTASPLHWTQPGHHVMIDHGDGWTTLYAHMAPGSITVDVGATVVAGERLGAIGATGDARFAHLHFEVQHDGAVVDPFSGTGPGIICGVSLASLWSDEAISALAYRPTGLLRHGFAGGLIRDGAAPALSLPDAATIVFWADLFGLMPGDRVEAQLLAPDGRVLAAEPTDIDTVAARLLTQAGYRKPETGWPAGAYRGSVTLMRPGSDGWQIIADAEMTLHMP